MSRRVCDLAAHGSCTPRVFLFWLLQMESSRVPCHSRAPALPAAQTNIITASPIQTHAQIHTPILEHSLSQIPLPNTAWHHTLVESAIPDQIPRTISYGMPLFFFQWFLGILKSVSGGKISSRHRGRRTGKDISLAQIDTVQAHTHSTHTQMKTTSFQGSPLYGLLHGAA